MSGRGRGEAGDQGECVLAAGSITCRGLLTDRRRGQKEDVFRTMKCSVSCPVCLFVCSRVVLCLLSGADFVLCLLSGAYFVLCLVGVRVVRCGVGLCESVTCCGVRRCGYFLCGEV